MSRIYRALGLMSGTSLDGVDAAILETDGERIVGFGPTRTFSYSEEQKNSLTEATKAALRWNFEGPRPNSLYRAQEIIDAAHADAIEAFLEATGLQASEVDLIGYHGQTMLHDATRGKTLQIGSGQSLADRFGIPCVYDFRSEDVAKGGQGAPLAPIYHKALVEHATLAEVTAVLNLGGVGNVTIIDGEKLLASDTGPANGPLDSFLELRDIGFDKDGIISRGGEPDFERVDRWLERPFFKRTWPKSADRYDFDIIDDVSDMSVEDGAATLCSFTALSAANTIRSLGRSPDRVIVCGGGRHNPTIMTMLALELGCPVWPAERVGWDSDAIEAQAFAYLAVRVLQGLPNSFPTTTGVPEPTAGGVIARPA